jgi:alanyl-tRNA synthetase
VGRLDKMHGNVRIEFLCGMRAVRRARAGYDALNRIARTLETAVAAAPGAVAAQQERIKELDQTCRRLSLELARRRGREIYESSSVAASGLRLHENIFTAGAIGDDTRAEAKSFTSLPAAVYIAASREASTLLLAVSAGAGIEAGPLLKKVLSAAGGRGGGNATMAQGSVADNEALDAALAAIRREVESANFNRG